MKKRNILVLPWCTPRSSLSHSGNCIRPLICTTIKFQESNHLRPHYPIIPRLLRAVDDCISLHFSDFLFLDFIKEEFANKFLSSLTILSLKGICEVLWWFSTLIFYNQTLTCFYLFLHKINILLELVLLHAFSIFTKLIFLH